MNFEGSTDRERPGEVGGDAPSSAVVRAVAEAEKTDPSGLPSLYGCVDSDALDALFAGRSGGCITFEYYGYTVTVDDGEVLLHE